MELSELVTAWLEWSGLSKAEVARRLKISPEAIGQWCTGDTEPTQKNLRNFVDAIGISLTIFHGYHPAACTKDAS